MNLRILLFLLAAFFSFSVETAGAQAVRTDGDIILTPGGVICGAGTSLVTNCPASSLNLIPNITTTRQLCLFGDSIAFNSDQTTGTPPTSFLAETTGGFGTWLNVYTGYRAWRSPGTTYNFGVGGNTTTQMLDRIGTVLAAGCQTVAMDGGVNDAATFTCAQTVANLKQIFATFLGAGIAVVDTTIMPASGKSWTTAQQNAALCVNTWRRQFARGPPNLSRGYYLVDLDPIMTDPSQATWTILSGYQQNDGVHPSAIGGSAMGYAMAQAINQLIPPWLAPALTPSDVYDAVNNPRGNLLPNGQFTGSGGSLSNCTQATGTPPTSVTIADQPASNGFTANGGACAITLNTLSNGVTAIQAVLSGTLTALGNFDILQVISSPSQTINPGDSLRGMMWVNLGSTNTNLGYLDPILSITDSTGATSHSAFQNSVPYALPATGFQPTYDLAGQNWVALVTDTYTTIGAVTSVNFRLRTGVAATGVVASTVQTCCWEVRKVIP